MAEPLSMFAGANDIRTLRIAVHQIETRADDALSEIAAVATMARAWLTQSGPTFNPGVAAYAMGMILDRAEAARDGISLSASSVGCGPEASYE